MVLSATAPLRQPTGPQIATIIANSGLRTPKVRRNRTHGHYTAEWCQSGLIKSVPPASFFREKMETRFDGIKILNTQEVKASWREGNPIIIALVHFEITDVLREKREKCEKCEKNENQVSLSVLIPQLIETIQRVAGALPTPQQPIALLPAFTMTRPRRETVAPPQPVQSATVLIGFPPLTLIATPLPTTWGGAGGGDNIAPLATSAAQWRGVGGEVNLPNTQFIRAHGKSALVQKLRDEAAQAGANAVQHYRIVNPPRTFPTLADMVQDTETITITLDQPEDNSTL